MTIKADVHGPARAFATRTTLRGVIGLLLSIASASTLTALEPGFTLEGKIA
jgi:hypothetical protein